MVMKCPMCNKGKMTVKTVDGLRHGIFLGHFKAHVCNLCKEEIYDASEAGKIEKRIKELGLWGRQESTVYKVGGNLALGIKKALANALKLSKGETARVFPQIRERRIIVEFS